MPKRTVNQGHHAVGEVVLVEKLGTVNLTLDERIEAEHRGPAVGGKDGGSGIAKSLLISNNPQQHVPMGSRARYTVQTYGVSA